MIKDRIAPQNVFNIFSIILWRYFCEQKFFFKIMQYMLFLIHQIKYDRENNFSITNINKANTNIINITYQTTPKCKYFQKTKMIFF